MPAEIERKFLVANDGWRTHADAGTLLDQAYLLVSDPDSINPLEVRVRCAPGKAWLTAKGGHGIHREEVERPIDPELGRQLANSATEGRVQKTRYRVPHGELVFEVDVYDGPLAGLVTAEVELPQVDTPIDPPEWLGEEISGDPTWSNRSLAWHGVPSRAVRRSADAARKPALQMG